MNKETDSVLSWEALCGYIVSPVLITHVKIIHDPALLSALLSAPQSATSLSASPSTFTSPDVSKCWALMCSLSTTHREIMAPGSQEWFWLWAASGSEVSAHPRCRKDSFIILAPVLRLGFEKTVPAPCAWALRWGAQGGRCHWQVTEEFRQARPQNWWKGREAEREEERERGTQQSTPTRRVLWKGSTPFALKIRPGLRGTAEVVGGGVSAPDRPGSAGLTLDPQNRGSRDAETRSKGQGKWGWELFREVQSHRISAQGRQGASSFCPFRQLCALSVTIELYIRPNSQTTRGTVTKYHRPGG